VSVPVRLACDHWVVPPGAVSKLVVWLAVWAPVWSQTRARLTGPPGRVR